VLMLQALKRTWARQLLNQLSHDSARKPPKAYKNG
jgi:hypothetical protein